MPAIALHEACIARGDQFLIQQNDAERAHVLYEQHPSKDSDPALLARRAVVAVMRCEVLDAVRLWSRAVDLDRGIERFTKLWASGQPRIQDAVMRLTQLEDTVPCSPASRRAR